MASQAPEVPVTRAVPPAFQDVSGRGGGWLHLDGPDSTQTVIEDLISGRLSAEAILDAQPNRQQAAHDLYVRLRSGHPLLARTFIPFAAFPNCQFLSILDASTSDINIGRLSESFDSLLMPDALPPSRDRAIAPSGLMIGRILQDLEARSPMLNMATADPELAFTFDRLVFTQLCFCRVREILARHSDCICKRIGVEQFRALADSLCDLERQRQAEVIGWLEKADTDRDLIAGIEKLRAKGNEQFDGHGQLAMEIEKQRMANWQSEASASWRLHPGAVKCVESIEVSDVLGILGDLFKVGSSVYKRDVLRSVLVGDTCHARWSSNPRSRVFESLTIRFRTGLFVRLSGYSLRDGFGGRSSGVHGTESSPVVIDPFLKSWKVTGRTRFRKTVTGQARFGETVTLSEVRDSDMLGDHKVHSFSVNKEAFVNEITLQMTAPNNGGSSQLHVGRFILSGRICYQSSMLDGQGAICQIVPEIHKLGFHAKRELHVPQLMTEMAAFEYVKALQATASGQVRVAQSASGELFAAKHYNPGGSTATRSAFMEQLQRFCTLDHENVIPIRGLIAPTSTAGPIVLTPFSALGSLGDVLKQVRESRPPPFWSEPTITRILTDLARGLRYLHWRKIVHGNLKPSGVIIVAEDGSAKVCGYMTTFLRNQGYTWASQTGSSSYMAPELYSVGTIREPAKIDVFAFGLIVFEIFAGRQVFPSTMRPIDIMRCVSDLATRPSVPENVPDVLADLIRRCWVPDPSRRPTFEEIVRDLTGIPGADPLVTLGEV